MDLPDGDSKAVVAKDIPAPFILSGEWRLILEGRGFPRLEKTLRHLDSWTKDPKTESFSGTGRYEIEFDLPTEYCADDLRLELDLGKVGNVAEVRINGKNVGTCWIRGQTLDATKALRPGRNSMEVLVTNTLINRVSHFKEAPPVPDSLVPHYGKGLSPPQPGVMGFKPLPASGLIGPVMIRALKEVSIALE